MEAIEPNPLIADLIQDISRPLYNWRMAHSVLKMPVHSKSAATRLKNAEREIDDAINKYVIRREDASS